MTGAPVTAATAPSGAECRVERALHRGPEAESDRDGLHRVFDMIPGVVVRVEVKAAADGREVHLVEAKVGEDRQVSHRQYLVQVLLVRYRELEVVEYLLRQGIVERRADIGQKYRNLVANHPDRYEEVVVDPGEAYRASEAGLLPQHPDEPLQVIGHGHRQDVSVPPVVFTEDYDRKICLAYLRHRHGTKIPPPGTPAWLLLSCTV